MKTKAATSGPTVTATERAAIEAGSRPAEWWRGLPQISTAEAGRLRRRAALSEKMAPWSPRLLTHLPVALGSWWPYRSVEEFVAVLRLRLADGTVQDVRLDRSPSRVGRGEGCHIQLPSPTVSAEHVEFRLDRGRLTAMDLRSTNGTRHNGTPIEPLVPIPLDPGDRIDLGPFTITFVEMARSEAGTVDLKLRASSPHPIVDSNPFKLLSHPADRWVRVQLGGVLAFVKIPFQWIRGCWQRVIEVRHDDTSGVDPLEEGVAQFVLMQVATSLSERLGSPVQLESWLTPAECEKLSGGVSEWLQSDAWIGSPAGDVVISILLPLPGEESAAARPIFDESEVPYLVLLDVGLIRLKLTDWRQVDPGDALLLDQFLLAGWEASGDRELGSAVARTGRFWHTGRLRLQAGRLTLNLDRLWLTTPGGGLFMPEKEVPAGDSESVPVQDLELQVMVEFDRFAVTIGELKKWQPGQCVTLQRALQDPVRLVLETGAQRRVLAEGRIVVVDGRLGIEVSKLYTQLQDGGK